MEKRERTQINNIITEKDITMNITEIQRLLGYYKKQYVNKLNNIDEMGKILRKIQLRLNQEEIENLNWPVTSKEIGNLKFHSEEKSRWFHWLILSNLERTNISPSQLF